MSVRLYPSTVAMAQDKGLGTHRGHRMKRVHHGHGRIRSRPSPITGETNGIFLEVNIDGVHRFAVPAAKGFWAHTRHRRDRSAPQRGAPVPEAHRCAPTARPQAVNDARSSQRFRPAVWAKPTSFTTVKESGISVSSAGSVRVSSVVHHELTAVVSGVHEEQFALRVVVPVGKRNLERDRQRAVPVVSDSQITVVPGVVGSERLVGVKIRDGGGATQKLAAK